MNTMAQLDKESLKKLHEKKEKPKQWFYEYKIDFYLTPYDEN